MQLPTETSSPRVRVRFGRYVQAKLQRAKHDDLALAMREATDRMKVAARLVEDREEVDTLARAQRDGIDDVTDAHVQDARNQLAGRSVAAAREAPLTAIFAEGVEFYTASSLENWDQRMGLFAARIEKNLDPTDPLKATVLSLIAKDREAFKAVREAIAAERTKTTLASDDLASATEAWERQAEKTFGALIQIYGRRRAERFFPRLRREVEDALPVPEAPTPT